MKGTLESFIKAMTLAVLTWAAFLQIQPNGHAQNLADLHYFSDESSPYTGFIQVQDATTAYFPGYQIYEQLNLSGTVSTVSNATYAISFTFQENPSPYTDGSGRMTFGSTVVSLDDAFLPYQRDQYGLFDFPPVNVSFTASAISEATPASFNLVLDNGMSAQLSDVSITAVPEVSALTLLLSGGCVLFLAQQWRNYSKRAWSIATAHILPR